jgi:capsular exopolysaccharide synthesis family protein
MGVHELVRAIRRRWHILLGAIGLAIGLSAALTALAVPQYATSVTFFVTTPSQGVTDSYQGGLFSEQRVKSYVELLQGDRLARAAATDPDIGLTPQQIQNEVRAYGVPDTVLLRATVTDSDRARSTRVASALAQHFVELVQALETPPGASQATVKVEVVAGPQGASTPVSPRPARNLALAGLLGLLAGVLLAVLRETLDVTVKTPEALQAASGAPVLGQIPYEDSAKHSPLVLSERGRSVRAEALRQLRTNLQFVDVDRPLKAIVFTSAVPDEGKSSTSANLAIAFAEAGTRVLLVDADLRRPRLADYLGLEGAVGLSNVLAGQVAIEDALQPWGQHDLRVLTGGILPANPSELLGSRNMATLLDKLRAAFDVIIIDSPPLLPVTDAAVLAAVADGAVMVSRAARTKQAQVAAAVASLRAVEARVLGCVLNMRRRGASDAGYYYQNRYELIDRRRARRQPLAALRRLQRVLTGSLRRPGRVRPKDVQPVGALVIEATPLPPLSGAQSPAAAGSAAGAVSAVLDSDGQLIRPAR